LALAEQYLAQIELPLFLFFGNSSVAPCRWSAYQFPDTASIGATVVIMGRAQRTLQRAGGASTDPFSDVFGTTRGRQLTRSELEGLAQKITYVTSGSEWDGFYLGQELVWQGHPDDLEIDLLERLQIPFERIAENEVLLPGGKQADNGPWAKDGNSFLSRIAHSRGSCPVAVVSTKLWLGIYYMGKRIWQGVPESMEGIELMFEQLPYPFTIIKGNRHKLLEDGHLPQNLPTWIVSDPTLQAQKRRLPLILTGSLRGMWRTRKSEHYIFYFPSESLAAEKIVAIERLQEDCYAEITKALGVTMPWPICYFLCSSREEVGREYGDGVPINAFAREPNLIYATYNKTIKCIGPHEDAHLISYQLAKPPWRWLREGLAMHFDKTQNSIPLKVWVGVAAQLGVLPEADTLWCDKDFDKLNELMSYPLVGFLTEEIVKMRGLEEYRAFYAASVSDGPVAFQRAFSAPFVEFYSRATDSARYANYEPKAAKRVEQILVAREKSGG